MVFLPLTASLNVVHISNWPEAIVPPPRPQRLPRKALVVPKDFPRPYEVIRIVTSDIQNQAALLFRFEEGGWERG